MSFYDVDVHNVLFLASMSALALGCDAPEDNRPGPFTATAASTNPAGTGGDDDGGADDGADDGGDDDDGNMDSSPVTSGPSNDEGPADGPADGADESTSGPMDGPMDVGDSGDTYGDGYGSDGSGGMVMVGMLCQDYADLMAECYQYTPEQTMEAAQFCQLDIQYGTAESAACGMAIEEFYACLSNNTCKSLETAECPFPKAACPGAGAGDDGG